MALHAKENQRPRFGASKFGLVAVILAAMVLVGVGTTIAWLTATTGEVTNTFTAAHVGVVATSGDGKVTVSSSNDQDVDEYVRVKVVANWVDDEGSVIAEPVKSDDVKFTLADGWQMYPSASDNAMNAAGLNGCYLYYTGTNGDAKFAPNRHDVLVLSYEPKSKDGYQLEVKVLASALQADEKAAADAWRMKLEEDGRWYLLTTGTN